MLFQDLATYLAQRKPLIASREAFLLAAKMYLANEQRPDAGDLQEPRWNHPARQFRSHDWIINPTRGYLVLREDVNSRPFRLVVEQPGNCLVIEVSMPDAPGDGDFQGRFDRFQSHLSIDQLGNAVEHRTEEGAQKRQSCRWQIPVPELYTSVRAAENAHFQIWRVFDAAVNHLIPA